MTKETLKANKVKQARNEEKTDHDPNHETDDNYRNRSSSSRRDRSRGRGRSGSPGPRSPRVETRLEKVCIFYNHGICKSSAKDCPLAHNPTCKFYSSPNGCRNGDKCFSPHRARGGLMALRSPLSKRETCVEKKKLADASQPSVKAKATAKVKVKAKAKAAKVPGTVLLLKKNDDEGEDPDAIQRS